MVGELSTLPLRTGVRVTQLWLRAAEATVAVEAHLTGRVIGATRSRGAGDGKEWAPAASRETQRKAPERARWSGEERAQSAPTEATPPARTAPATQAPPPPAASQTPQPTISPDLRGASLSPGSGPVHVSEEPELVEEFAESEAEQGAGAEVHVEPPWADYEQMNAKQVIARLVAARPAELAAVQLYESGHRRRQSILNAVERELRNNGSGSPTH